MSKKDRHVSANTLKFFGGIGLMLLSVIMILNIGYVAKGISYGFYYLFGLGAYLFFIYLFLIGITLIIKKHYPKFSFKFYLCLFLITVGLFTFIASVTSLSLGTLFTLSENAEGKVNFFTYTNNIFVNMGEGKGYFQTTGFIDFFYQNPILGGLVGNLLTALLFDGVGPVFAIIIEWVFILAGLAIVLVPYLIKRIKKQPKKQKSANKENLIKNFDVISNANQVPSEEQVQQEENKFIGNSQSFVHFSTSANNVCRFLKEESEPLSNIKDNKFFIEEENDIEPTEEEENKTTKEPIYEQTTLDFDAEQPVDMTLATKKPEFVEQAISEEVMKELIEEEVKPKEVIIPHEEKKEKPKIKWVPPSLDLLFDSKQDDNNKLNDDVAKERQQLINETFKVHGIRAKCVSYIIGPSVTRYEIEYEEGEISKNIENKIVEFSIALSGISILFNKIVPGTKHSSFEIPNAKINPVNFKSVISSLEENNCKKTDIGFGLDITGQLIKGDFTKFPHLLLAGTTGSGKSVFLNSLFLTLIMRNSPEELKLIIVDPKILDTKVYSNMPHLLCPVISTVSETKIMLDRLYEEMNERYQIIGDEGFAGISEYNEYMRSVNKPVLPIIIVSLDEFADLVGQCKEISQLVVSIAQKARAAGIHLIIATQRPSTDVITGTIKGNLPTRAALLAASYTDSITMIGEKGAESLLGNGDMLVQSPLVSRNGCVRCQGAYVHPIEIKRVISYLKEHYEPDFSERFLNLVETTSSSNPMANASSGDFDGKYESIRSYVMTQKYMSMSKIQRECRVGFNRAGLIFKQLIDEGVISPNQASPSLGNEVLIQDEALLGK